MSTPAHPPLLRDKASLRAAAARWREHHERIGVVPTMGALHEGHLSLVRAAKLDCDRVIVTIFVNPKQFNRASDLETYPRAEAADIEMLAPLHIDAIYAPATDAIYPPGFATNVHVAGLGDDLCGADRPGHFDGVATIVTKLLLQTGADRAYFGEKDFQQLQLVRRLTADLDIPVRVIGCPTMREADGLALSSRNRRLTEAGRAAAPALHREMKRVVAALLDGHPSGTALARATDALRAAGFTEIDYLELRAEDGLRPLETPSEPARLFAAAWIDGVRLIDNIPVA